MFPDWQEVIHILQALKKIKVKSMIFIEWIQLSQKFDILEIIKPLQAIAYL